MHDDSRTLTGSLLARLEYESLFGLEAFPSPPSDIMPDNIDVIAAEVLNCRKCGLCESRTNAVPGEGNAAAEIIFVGEAPGYHEDVQGRPFVGRAGKLLDRMMAAINLDRSAVFITNVVKCRPPGNQTPGPAEIPVCFPYLQRQVALIRPRIVCALGSVAVSTLLGQPTRITSARGKRHQLGRSVLIPTYHPAYLLRNPSSKREAWHDLQLIRKILDDPSGETSEEPV